MLTSDLLEGIRNVPVVFADDVTGEIMNQDNLSQLRKASGDSPNKAWMRALEKTAPITNNPTVLLPHLIDDLADRFGAAPALVSEHQTLSYRDLAEKSHRYSLWALQQGLSFGQVACLLMRNCPEYLAIWLGITRVGGIVALLNTNLVGDSLLHAINVAAPKTIIVGAEQVDAFAPVAGRLSPEIETWSYGQNAAGLARIDDEINRLPRAELSRLEYRSPTIKDNALYIYTSGTTGLPKAANVSHHRLMQWSHWFAGMMNTQPDDRMYNCLPMYHSVGGVVAIGATLVSGGSVLLREGFSASRFWDDVVESKCTMFQYIGELCRYLVNTPPHKRETQHGLRLACGNGLRAEVWQEFVRRFHIPRIVEFYASTEGSFSLYNCHGRPGSIGRVPSFLAHRTPIAVVRNDPETGEPHRDEQGFCMPCAVNEVGEAIGKISDAGSAGGRFEGYADKAASEKKILRDVFERGDSWFRTGDLMRKDEQAFFYFVDRVGDTFRWKGENVSTTEVAAAISTYPDVVDAVVYGVRIPGTEGRAGMVEAAVKREIDLQALRDHLVATLPVYARPLFLRMVTKIDATATFKLKKHTLTGAAYDPSTTADAIYFNDPDQGGFVRVTPAIFEDIQSGRKRL